MLYKDQINSVNLSHIIGTNQKNNTKEQENNK